MTAPTLRLSDLSGPDADGWSDVAHFDGIDDPTPFVVTADRRCLFADGSTTTVYGKAAVVRLGRGRLVPARIEMQGEADLAERVRVLHHALGVSIRICDRLADQQAMPDDSYVAELEQVRNALAMTAPKERP